MGDPGNEAKILPLAFYYWMSLVTYSNVTIPSKDDVKSITFQRAATRITCSSKN